MTLIPAAGNYCFCLFAGPVGVQRYRLEQAGARFPEGGDPAPGVRGGGGLRRLTHHDLDGGRAGSLQAGSGACVVAQGDPVVFALEADSGTPRLSVGKKQ